MAERLTAADSWFLYLETATVHLHVTGVVLLDPDADGRPLPHDRLRRNVEERLHRLALLRRRLVEVPAGIDHPVRIEDPGFDLGDHLHQVDLGGGAGHRELVDLVGRFCSEPLPRTRPLWEMVHVTGMADGRTALVTKLHHALVDGVSGMGFLADLLDLEPDAPPPPPPETEWRPDRVPSGAETAAGAAWHRLRTPLRPLRALLRTTRSGFDMAGAAVRTRRAGRSVAGPFDAPRTPFNSTLTARRSVEFGATSLSATRAVRRAFGVTVNDVVLAACTHGLRQLLVRGGWPVDRPLTCSVPVSVHGRHVDADGVSVNQVSNMFVHLPVDLADPVEQLLAVQASSAGAKRVQDATSPEIIGDVVDLIPPPMFHLGAELWSRARLADRLPPVHNLIVSNVKGSPVPLYLAGSRLAGLYPFGPLMEGTALNVTVLSQEDDLDVGLISCPDLIPDLDVLLADVLEGFDELHRRSEHRTAAGETGTP